MSIPQSLKKMQKDHFDQIGEKVQRRLNWEVERPDLMSYVIKYNDEIGMSLDEIQATFTVLTTAGSETTATALSGTLNYLAANGNETTLLSLVQEVRQSFNSEDDITFEKLAGLQFLNAVIHEGLRLCPPVPIMLPRVVPEGGDTVCGIWLPAGVGLLLFLSYLQKLTLFDTRRAYHYNSGHCSVTPNTSTNPLVFYRSVGYPKLEKRPHLSLMITATVFSHLASDPALVWVKI